METNQSQPVLHTHTRTHTRGADIITSCHRPPRRPSDFPQVQLGDIWRAEGAQVQTPVVLVGLADVRRHLAARVVEAARADAAVVELRHQAVARDELQQDVLAEELQGRAKVKTDAWLQQ